MKYIRKYKRKKEVEKSYEKQASRYDYIRSASFEGKIVDKLQRELIYKNLGLKKGKVLEAGCGTGRILLYLAEKGVSCYGIDPSENMLNILRKKAKQKKIKMIVKKADIEKIPFKNNTFDGVYTVHVLMHMPDYKKAFKEMYRVLKPNGKLIMDFPNLNSPWTKFSILLNPKKKRTRIFTIKELKEFFKGHNYKIDGLFSYARTFYKIPILRNLICLLEKYVKLPVSWRTQIFFIITKSK